MDWSQNNNTETPGGEVSGHPPDSILASQDRDPTLQDEASQGGAELEILTELASVGVMYTRVTYLDNIDENVDGSINHKCKVSQSRENLCPCRPGN